MVTRNRDKKSVTLHLLSRLRCSTSAMKGDLRAKQVYRGKVFGPILATLGILMFGFFSYVFFYQLRQVPPSTGAPRVGQKAPDFTLLDQDGKDVAPR